MRYTVETKELKLKCISLLFIFAAFGLAGCAAPILQPDAPVVVPAPDVPAPVTKPANIEKTCPLPGVYQAVDASEPVTQRFLDVMKYLGIKTIIRYGDYVNETIKGKTPKPAERKLIQSNGFAELFVFQHNNSKFASFTAARGKSDAERMQELYPEVPAWYYGVDFDPDSTQMKNILIYATEFKKVADKFGKKVGAYGSGYTLDTLENAGLIHYRWISMSTGFRGTKAATLAKRYNLLQFLDKDCGGINVDFNKVNGDIGAFR